MTIDENIPLKHLNTFKIGGAARYFCVAKSVDDLKEAAAFAHRIKVPIFVLGGGSNILISDEGFPGLVIKMALRGITFEDNKDYAKVRAAAGENWDGFVDEVVKNGLWGVENLSGIPGTVGGALVQNIGAYGAEVLSVIESVEIFDTGNLATRTISAAQCRFKYRDSLFKHPDGKNYIITSVLFRLSKEGKPNIFYKDLERYFGEPGAPKPDLSAVRKAVLKIRAGKFPPLGKFGTAGSFFKNPLVSEYILTDIRKSFPEIPAFAASGGFVKLPLAWILDKACNFKGRRMGPVGLYEKQPLVLVNFGEASAHEVSVFADKVAADVKERIGVDIEREVQSIGEDNPPVRYQTWFWAAVYFIMPKLAAFIQFFGWHHFRENYFIGFLRKDRGLEDLIKYLREGGYAKAYMAWKEPGEVLSLRRIARCKFQYHLRLFENGEIRGHYEYAPEASPVGHLRRAVFTDPKDYFEHLLCEFLER
jgi:UDP-N-acetylmuramate dehydrogenase